MSSYKEAGVDVDTGDKASASAYAHASATFASRKGMIGEPVLEKDGYAGFLDMGDFFLVQSDDSTGTKIDLAFDCNTFDTLGYDLVAMVADDAVCTGAEPLSISNTIDVPKIDPKVIDALMSGLSKACSEQKIVVPAGEIAEVPNAVTNAVWSATVVGIVKKDKIIKPETVEPGDVILTLQSGVARSNGFSLIRKILSDEFGPEWYSREWKNGVSWGKTFLSPSVIYTDAILSLIGRYGEERAVDVKGIAHITGGGIPSKLRRILRKSGCGANLQDLWEPHEAMRDLIRIGGVALDEAYKTWNMGNGMMLIVKPDEVEQAISLLGKKNRNAKIAGIVTKEKDISITAADGTEFFFE